MSNRFPAPPSGFDRARGPLREINFDGIVGPSHNYGGLSLGNLASAKHALAISHPRAAALQGVAKMRANLDLGLVQGVFLPHPRPDRPWLARLGADAPTDVEGALRAAAYSASAMWAANAATVSPTPDTGDGRCHLTVANLATMAHRSHEWPETLRQLRLIFADPAFRVHAPVPAPFGDEGAANHMRLASRHDGPGIEIFVYGVAGGRFPARQHEQASRAVARLHGLDPARTLFVAQSESAIAAGAFHNDVVATANEHVLFTHEHAFADAPAFYAELRTRLPEVEIVEIPAAVISLEDAVASYLFNAQLVTTDQGMVLIVPGEATAHARVSIWLERMLAGNGPIRRVIAVDVRESMANGGGPACLRLRVLCDPARVDPRFLVDGARLDRIAAVIDAHWPETIRPTDLGDPALDAQIQAARTALCATLDVPELSENLTGAWKV